MSNLDSIAVLRDHGLQVTAQRAAVLKTVAAHPHSTVDDILTRVRAEIGTISKQSVYDSLGVLVSAGVLRRIQPEGSPALFEDRVGDNHHHLVCRDCGRVVDVDCAVGQAPCLEAKQSHGFEIDEAEVAYWGRCPQCQQKNEGQQRNEGQQKNEGQHESQRHSRQQEEVHPG